MKKIIFLIVGIALINLIYAGNNFWINTSSGDILINSSIINGTKINWSDVLNVPSGIVDTNETIRFNNLIGNCSSNQVMFGVASDGSRVCVADQTGGGGGINVTHLTNLTDVTITSPANRSIIYYDSDSGSWLDILFETLFDVFFSGKTTDDLTEGLTNLYDNQSWNQPLADTLYAGIGAGGDNESWNESYANTLYAGIEWNYNQTTASVNILNGTGLIRNWNDTGLIINWSEIITSGTTYTHLSNFTNDGIFVTNSTMNKSVDWTDILGIPSGFADGVDNTSSGGADWTEITSKPAGFSDDIDNDTTYTHLSNFTDDLGKGNWTADKGDYYTSAQTDTAIETANTSMKGYVDGLNASMKDYVDGEIAGVSGGNASWNESYAKTIFRLQSWDNFTGIPTATPSNGDATHLSTADQIYDWVISLAYATTTYVDNAIASIGNWSADKSNYYNSTQVDTEIINANASMKDYVDNQADSDTWSTNFTNYFNKTDIFGFSYYNASDFDIADYSTTAQMNTAIETANTSMKTYTDGLNASMKTYVDAQDSAQDECSEITGCVTGAITDVVSDTTPQLGGNLDTQNKNVTDVQCVTFNNGASWCGV